MRSGCNTTLYHRRAACRQRPRTEWQERRQVAVFPATCRAYDERWSTAHSIRCESLQAGGCRQSADHAEARQSTVHGIDREGAYAASACVERVQELAVRTHDD